MPSYITLSVSSSYFYLKLGMGYVCGPFTITCLFTRLVPNLYFCFYHLFSLPKCIFILFSIFWKVFPIILLGEYRCILCLLFVLSTESCPPHAAHMCLNYGEWTLTANTYTDWCSFLSSLLNNMCSWAIMERWSQRTVFWGISLSGLETKKQKAGYTVQMLYFS